MDNHFSHALETQRSDIRHLRALSPFLLFFWAIFLLPLPLQGGTTGILEGIVKDKETNTPIPGATVLLVGTTIGRTTDVEGKFIFYNLTVGSYSVRVQMLGYTSMVYENVRIHADLRTKLTVALRQSAIEMNEIIVKSERPLIQKDIIGTIHTVTGDEIKVLPVTNFQDVIGFKPGTTLEGNIRGGKTSEVVYLIDGLPVQDVIEGGLGAEIPNSSIVEFSLQTGGFEAEFGNAQSGIVNVVTKSGSNESEVSARVLKDNSFGGTENNKENEVEVSMSGPIVNDKVFYFFSLNYNQNGTRWWQDFQNFFSMPVAKSFNGFGKVDVLFSPYLKWSTQILYSAKDWKDYEFSWRFNLGGLPPLKKDVYRVASSLTHTVSDNTYYSVRLSAYHNESRIGGTSKATIDPTQIYQYDLFLQYIISGQRAWWSLTDQDIYTIKSDFTSQLRSDNVLKLGGDFNLYRVQTDLVKYEPQVTYFGKPLLDKSQLNFSTQYRFFPKSGDAYIQDRISIEKATISLGLRYDFLNPTAQRPAFEYVPTAPNEYRLRFNHYVRAQIKNQISPRLSISVPMTENGFVFMNYGYYFQYPLFEYLYSGLDIVTVQHGVSAVAGNPNLDPERTKAWEIGLKNILYENVVGSVTYFRKESSNLIDTKTFIATDSKVAGDYGFAEYVNNPYAEATGVECVVSRSQGGVITGDISYTYMVAQGLSENANQGLNYLQWGFKPIATPFYLSWDQRHTVKVNAAVELPWGVQAHAFFHFYTARPYTYYPSRDGFTPSDTSMVFIPNNARMSPYANLDVKFTKTFHINFGRSTDIVLFVDSRNILKDHDVKWVDSSGRAGGELGDPSAYYQGRRTRIGVSMEVGI